MYLLFNKCLKICHHFTSDKLFSKQSDILTYFHSNILTKISLSFEVLVAVSSNTLKCDNDLIYMHKFSSYLRENTVQVHYKKQSVNAVWGNNVCLLSDSHKTWLQWVGKKAKFLNVTAGGTLKANSHIACRAHAVPLPCRTAKGVECVFPIWFTQRSHVWFTLAMPRSCHALTMAFF
jgi:hypothetical protein